MPGRESGRRCRQCGERIVWSTARFVASRTFCWEPCAIMWLFSAASRTSWTRIRLEMAEGRRSLRRRLQLARASALAASAQRRLDRRLASASAPRALPWLWLPSVRGATALAAALAACGISGGRAPAPVVMAAVRETPPPSPVLLRPALGAVPAAPVAPSAVVPTHAPLPPEPPPVSPMTERAAPPVAPTARRPPAARRAIAEDVVRGDMAVRQLAFTFDGGSEANAAGDILDSLRARNIRATMFLTGQFIRLHPEWVRRMVADGHEIGNHLDTHPHLTTYERNRRQETLPVVDREFLLGQLRRAAESFRSLTGRPMAPFWRAPYGEHNAEIRAWAAEAGYRHISWTRGAGTAEDLDTRDWVADRSSRIYRSREEIAARILEFGNGRPEGLNGGIVLMHLGTHRQSDRPHEMLPDVLKRLQTQGYRLVTISDLLGPLQTDREPKTPTP